MPEPGEVLVSISGVLKHHGGLRPLRIRQLDLRAGETVALLGFDQVAAEVLVNLVTGAAVPDEGEVRALGQLTSAIPDGDAWLTLLDRFGILTDRAVLLDQMTAEQNLAMPMSLDLYALPDDVRARVASLAADVGLGSTDLAMPVAELAPLARARLRLARALALDPLLILAEHPNAPLAAADRPSFAADLARVLARRGTAAIIVTADEDFARAATGRVLTLQPATGNLTDTRGWRRWFT